jgi:hypothetical protein
MTFHLVLFGWIFFRSNSLGDAWYILTHLWTGVPYTLSHLTQLGWSDTMMFGYNIGIGKVDFAVTVALVLFMEYIHSIQRHSEMRIFLTGKPIWFRWAIYYSLILFIILFGVDRSNQFIYFQF